MMRESKLFKIKKLLNGYFAYFKDSNVLVVSEDKSVLPFLYLITDPNYPGICLMSVAVDYNNCLSALEIALLANTIMPVMLGDPFYISNNDGKTYFSDDAYFKWNVETIPLKDLDAISNAIN